TVPSRPLRIGVNLAPATGESPAPRSLAPARGHIQKACKINGLYNNMGQGNSKHGNEGMTHPANATIVLVDDSPAMKTVFERGTQGLGVELLIFDSASASWEYLQENRPHLLFLNIKMPGKDG